MARLYFLDPRTGKRTRHTVPNPKPIRPARKVADKSELAAKRDKAAKKH